ncbi:GNAT family N-acetyltransferase [Dongia deserti]|uniref:GNAT family N-acetyltransferase n=1 Tax=Dongia deserti TaxID=2268030 RepID=UPI000E6531A3|nr:GNAT family N-acetyltransferase [Dongia deserti]
MALIREAVTPRELDDVRSLMRAFVAWHHERHVEDVTLIERYFDRRAFDQELEGLPGKYARPQGRLLIAYQDGQAAGCVALRDLGDGVCEMKRMFVPASFRGTGIGRALATRIIAEARDAGYRRMRLDTSKRQREAMRLYESAGFQRIAPYYALPDDVKDWLVFFELTLQD